jgi:hypothetical protein
MISAQRQPHTTDMNKTVITLSKPITVSGAQVSEIALRQPSMNDIFTAGVELLHPDRMTGQQINKLIATLAQLTTEEAGSMSPPDWQKAAAAVTDFLT